MSLNDPLEVDPLKIPLPPYYPDVPEIRHGMAVMYSNIARMDRQVQVIFTHSTWIYSFI